MQFGHRFAAMLTILLLATAKAGYAQQPDSMKARAVTYADSILRETCRGGRLSTSGLTCSGATASPRVTVIRRLANSIKAAMAGPIVVPPPPPPPPPDPVVLPTPTALAPGSATAPGPVAPLTPTFSWQPVAGATGYIVAIRDIGSGTIVYPSATGVGPPHSGTAFTLPAGVLVAGSGYRWDVTAVNATGKSAASADRYFTIAPVVTPPPSGSNLPELPRAVPVVPAGLASLPCTVQVPAGGLQSAYNAPRTSTTTVLCLTGTHTGSFTVPACPAGAGWRVTRSAASLPAGRMRPSLAGPLAKIVTPGSAGNAALRFAARSCRELILGVEITSVAAMTTGPSALVEIGTGSEAVVSDLPTDIAFQSVYIHGWPAQSIRRAFAFNGAALTVTASWCSEIHASGFDSQCVASWNGFGPMLIADNYLEAASENISFGGSQNNLVGVLPSDITIRRNHIAKPLGWKGAGWNVKNLIESKFSRRVLVEDNFLEGTWADAQSGNILLLKAGNPGGCNWCTTTDWTMRWNYIRNVSDGFAFGGRAEMGTGSSGAFVHQDSTVRRVLIEDNWIGPMGIAPYTGRGRLVSFDVDNRWITIRRNVFEGATGSQASAVLFGDTTARDIEITGNVLARGLYGLFTGGASEGLASWNAGPRNPKQWSGNCIIGSTAAVYPPGTSWGTLASCLTVTGLSRTALDARVAGVVQQP